MKIVCQRFKAGKGGDDLHMVKASHDMLKEALPKDYMVVSTPTDIVSLNPDDIVISIDHKVYSMKDILEIIEKAEIYDDLAT